MSFEGFNPRLHYWLNLKTIVGQVDEIMFSLGRGVGELESRRDRDIICRNDFKRVRIQRY